MSKVKLRRTASANPVSAPNSETLNKAGIGATTRRGFKFALQRLSMPAFRLHRYRSVRTRMLQELLSDQDCGN